MDGFPDLILTLPSYQGRFDARQLNAKGCEVLFASYHAGQSIAAHTHDTENVGLVTRGALYLSVDQVETRYGIGQWYHLPKDALHAARFEEDTSQIEFWFAERTDAVVAAAEPT